MSLKKQERRGGCCASAEVEERLVFARIEEQRNRSVEGRNLAEHTHQLALVLEKERDQNENDRLDKEHRLQIRVVYEKKRLVGRLR